MIEKVSLTRVRLNSGGYDAMGSYWGIGGPLYRADDPGNGDSRYMRARDRDHAKEVYRAQWRADAQFYR